MMTLAEFLAILILVGGIGLAGLAVAVVVWLSVGRE